jgi:hypothetical protein
MVSNKMARYVVGAWEPALEAIFNHHPSAKLAYTGRLDINDFTKVRYLRHVVIIYYILYIDAYVKGLKG